MDHHSDAGAVKGELKAREEAAAIPAGEEADRLAEIGRELPADLLIVMPVRRMVLFPGVTAPIAIGRPGSIAAARAAASADRPLAVVMQREAETEEPAPADLYEIGGVKEKVTAAARAGIKTVLLPSRNKKDFDDIPESAKRQLEFQWLETVDDALAALCPET